MIEAGIFIRVRDDFSKAQQPITCTEDGIMVFSCELLYKARSAIDITDEGIIYDLLKKG